jgi:hypothetical protein
MVQVAVSCIKFFTVFLMALHAENDFRVQGDPSEQKPLHIDLNSSRSYSNVLSI